MRWRTRLLTALIIYSAGFATAVYHLAPAEDQANAGQNSARRFDLRGQVSQMKTAEFRENAETGFKNFVGFAEEKAVEIGEYIRAKLAESDKK